jgi:inhibitor of KinA sporulation pathway (predicted exonuclease)
VSILNFDVRNDQMLFVDGEFTCFDGPPPPGEIPEMIEMGVANLDLRTLTIDRYDSYLIKNTLSSISPKCTELTGITQEKLDKEGRHFGEVMQSFRKKYGPANKAVGPGARMSRPSAVTVSTRRSITRFQAYSMILGVSIH